VPDEDRFPVSTTTPCTFTLTLTSAAGVAPISRTAFTFLDEHGGLHHPRVTAGGGGPLPTRLRPGRTLSLVLRAVVPTGNGQLRWAPEGAKPIVSWDFDVEID
jgi:hypothetical protein